jgi:hypothetical protein
MREVQMPAEHRLPPCPRCVNYDPGLTSTLCRLGGKENPIFYASLKNGPEYQCFVESRDARSRTNPR